MFQNKEFLRFIVNFWETLSQFRFICVYLNTFGLKREKPLSVLFSIRTRLVLEVAAGFDRRSPLGVLKRQNMMRTPSQISQIIFTNYQLPNNFPQHHGSQLNPQAQDRGCQPARANCRRQQHANGEAVEAVEEMPGWTQGR
jgi:hypothetical protein